MSEDGGARPAPLILDASVLIEAARGDAGVMTLLQGYDADGQPLIIPVLAVTAASLDTRSDDAESILHGLERLENAMAAPVRDAEQAVRLADVIARTGLGPWDAHVAAWRTRRPAPSSLSTRASGASTPGTLTNDCTSWRSPTPTRVAGGLLRSGLGGLDAGRTAAQLARLAQMLQSAWVGGRRAARMAGRRPAMAPMMMAAARPPAQASAGMTTASAWVRA